ncbi:sodium:solute symporter family protein [Balneolaceae bacterium ANBcel3]|nr:sodium:solute symporter family protein [Balneolaceae bacterium ANBcel3]
MHGIDLLIICAYFILLIFLSTFRRNKDHTESSFLLSGRSMTLPAFVATLVSTWYGGILGSGEYSYQFGISQWVVFGLPYYLFAILFAVFLAGKIRSNKALTIPEAISNTYSKGSGNVSALLIFLLVSPAPYILMLGLLFQFVTGSESHTLLFSVIVALFSVGYVSISGFKAVIRTDILQVILMYSGFFVLLVLAFNYAGMPWEIWGDLPETHRSFDGGHGIPFVLVWFFIALWTFVDPSFHQRAAAATSGSTARKGIYLSVGFWFIFDMCTALTGIYGFIILGDIDQPLLVYPELGRYLLPAGLTGLFFLTLLATIMSTLDSFLFISGQTLGRDLISRNYRIENPIHATRWAMLISAGIGILLIMIFPSVIALWYVIGSVIIPGLLLPVLGIYVPFFRVPQKLVMYSLLLPCLTSLAWLVLGVSVSEDLYSYAFLGLEPFYPGLALAIILLFAGKVLETNSEN